MAPPPRARFFDPKTPPTLITLILSIGLAALSMTVIVPSLTAVAAHFEAPYWQVQFLVSGFLFATAICQFFTGPLSDFLGRRRVLLWSVAIFTLAGVAAALAPSITVLLAARLVQSVIAAAMVIARATVRDTTSADKAASRIGYITMAMAMVPMAAPPIGGALQEAYDWPAAFWIMAGAGALIWCFIWRDMGETAPGKGQSFAAQFKTYPDLLTTRRFWAYTGVMASASATFFALLGGTPYLAEQVFALNPSQFGLYFALAPLGYILGNFSVGVFGTRLGINRMILIGVCIPFATMSAALILTLWGVTHPIAFFAGSVGIGIGNGMVLPNATTGIMNIKPELAGTGVGLSGAMVTVAGAVVSAITASALRPDSALYIILLTIIACCFLGVAISLIARWLERRASLRGNVPG